MLKATLTLVTKQVPLAVPTALAELDDDDVDFLVRHVAKLREESAAENSLLTRFHLGSGVPNLLQNLIGATPSDFVEASAGLAQRLQGSMDQATNPSVGVLAVISSGEGSIADTVSVLKLDAVSEAASYEFVSGQVRLSVLRDLLPAPGQLQKGLSWPDPRPGSEAVVIDRNITAAKYFFNAFELQVSATPAQTEKALVEAISKHIPRPNRAAAVQLASTLTGPAEQVVSALQQQYPNLQVEQPALGAGEGVGGFIRQNKVAAHRTRFMGDGIAVVVPWDRFDQVTGPTEVGGGWEMTIRFSARPREDTS
jgi:hypothetical protein